MTIVEMVQKDIWFYKRAEWGPGQFVHAERLYEDEKGVRGGVRTCWCHAPVTAAVDWKGDDLWMQYEGPECAAMTLLPALPGVLMDLDLPVALLALLALSRERKVREVKDEVGDIPAWAVGPPMRA